MYELTTRAYFSVALVVAWVLRASRYTTIRRNSPDSHVRKRRQWYAPLLVWLARPLLALLDAGVQLLPQRAWAARERQLYEDLYNARVAVEPSALLLPNLTGDTLATLLENPRITAPVRNMAIGEAARALAAFHRRGYTHADAMAQNVMIEVETATARWFDFETVHDPRRTLLWQRADDVRALLATCLQRTTPGEWSGTLTLVLDSYGDEAVVRELAAAFASPFRRALAYHLSQAWMSFDRFREIGRLLEERAAR